MKSLAYTMRSLKNNRAFTAVVILTLAIGIGANTAIFTLLDAVMLRHLRGVTDPQHLVLLKWRAKEYPKTRSSYVWTGCPQEPDDPTSSIPGSCSFSFPVYQQIYEQHDLFSDVAAFVGPAEVTSAINRQADLVDAEFVSGDFFSVLGVPLALGRSLEPSDDTTTAPPGVVLGHGYWKRLGSDPSIVGRTVVVNGAPFTIVGVTAPSFQGLNPGLRCDIWLPLSSQPSVIPNWPQRAQSDALWIEILGRLQPGVTLSQADSELSTVFDSLAAQSGSAIFKPSASPRIILRDLTRGLSSLRYRFAAPLLVLTLSVGIILVIVCANVASLMLVRSVARQREIAIRLALGARRRTIFRQLLQEGALLAALGGALGIVIAYWAARWIVAFLAHNYVLGMEIDTRPDLRILAFTLIVSAITAILFTLAPAFFATRLNPMSALKQGSTVAAPGGRQIHDRANSILVVAQAALSVLVLAGAGLLIRTLVNLEKQDMGFDARNVLLFSLDPAPNGYKGKQIASLFQDLQARLESLPGVGSVSYSLVSLMGGGMMSSDFYVPPQSQNRTFTADVLPVGPGFFKTMGIPLLSGRSFSTADMNSDAKPAPVIVNRMLARQIFGEENPLGHRFSGTDSKVDDWEVVGVVGDAKYYALRADKDPTVYWPLKDQGGAFEIRTTRDPRALIPMVRSVVSEMSGLAIFQVQTQKQQIEKMLYQERLIAGLSGLFGVLALVLACLGLYGLLSYQMVRRMREIGTRVALGAQKRHLFSLIIRRGITLAATGSIIGTVIALVLTRYLGSLLYEIKSTDPVTYVVTAVLLLVVSLLACYVPAYRATNIDPVIALRCE